MDGSCVEDKREYQTMTLHNYFKNADQSFFIKDLGALEFYILTYKCKTFFILVTSPKVMSGQTIIFSGWSTKIKKYLENFIRQAGDQVENRILTDHTYSEKKNSRRLRSLGGGLRKILSLIKGTDAFLKNKEIIKDLKYNIVLGDEEKVITQIFVVEKNSKNDYKRKPKMKEFNQLSITSGYEECNLLLNLFLELELAQNKFYEQLSNNKDGKKVILVDNYQKSVEK